MSTDAVRIPAAGEHGGDSWRLAAALGVAPADIIDLSASVNPFAPDVASLVARLATERPELLHRYPDADGATAAFAEAVGVDPSLVVLTNGGAEAIALVAEHEQVGEVIGPEFALYQRHLPRVTSGAPRWRSNPSNPLGRLAANDERARVWDEAFFAIATGAWTRGDRDAWRLGSLTKLWSCPGLRLGYALAPTAEEADAIRRCQPRWSVNALALAALPELLALTDLPVWSESIRTLRVAFADRLTALGFEVLHTDVNWVLVRHDGLREALAGFRVLVRDCTSFGLPGLARVALPHPDQIDHVVDAFAQAAQVAS